MPGGQPLSEERISIGDLEIDLDRHEVTRSGTRIELTDGEWKLLRALVAQRGKPVSSADLLSEIWGPSFRGDDAYLATWVWRLRQKIEPDAFHPSLLKTIAEVGYQLDA